MKTLRAFLVRDFRVAWSYRMSFLTQNAGLFFSLLSLKFVGNLFDGSSSPDLAPYGGDYFAFALVGMAVSFLSYPAVKSFAGAVRGSQVTGTFEAMLTTRASAGAIVFSGGAYPILLSAVQLVLAIVIGLVVFGVEVSPDHLLMVGVVLVLTMAALIGLGLLAAAFVVAFKQPEPFSGALLAASLMLSGGLYPPSVLPGWIEAFSPLLPLTHSLELARQLLLEDAARTSLGVHFGALALFALTVPAGLLALRLALSHARRAGSLAQY
ncbi:MAG: ABC transporter permease [Dehalococcoidia bacterium]|nr:ABC transporter permease [Dehalococcoidia bacterium]